ncbi:VWA domain-containing protein [uncultured Selenomonas sp.]|jgi:putative von willebrand factor type A domain protein|uniref:VWA domain-containing protein n=1 Tax=uncultured Selenomonas sp. TaxID=159275 RepID=UPI0028DC696D|nr:VWA domain-containing protein [uncultured Selenomonas sp.]
MAEAKENGTTELVFLIDVSAPMADFASDIIAGFNGMIAQLRETKEDILVTTWQFADVGLFIDERVPIDAGSAPLEEDFFDRMRIMREQLARQHSDPIEQVTNRGERGLINAIGGVVCRAKYVYRHYPENPARTMMIIITGGTDHASLYYWTPDQLRDLIERQEKETGWEFVFLGANIDALQAAGDLGIPVENAVAFDCDSTGIRENFASLGAMILAFSSTGVVPPRWSQKISEHLAKKSARI